MSDTVAILRKARDHIAQPGMWWQGEYFPGYDITETAENMAPPDDAPCCIFGALGWAFQRDPNDAFSEADALIVRAAQLRNIADVTTWQDAPGRTQAEVVALFDRAIELAEKEATS